MAIARISDQTVATRLSLWLVAGLTGTGTLAYWSLRVGVAPWAVWTCAVVGLAAGLVGPATVTVWTDLMARTCPRSTVCWWTLGAVPASLLVLAHWFAAVALLAYGATSLCVALVRLAAGPHRAPVPPIA